MPKAEKKKKAAHEELSGVDAWVYRCFARMNRNFENALGELERLCASDALKQSKRKLLRDARLAIAEARAWTNFEIVEALTEIEERHWTRLGKQRNAKKE